MTKLVYIGKQTCRGLVPIRLWNINNTASPYNNSTRSLQGLQELGIVSNKIQAKDGLREIS